jgi:hypothetical protein
MALDTLPGLSSILAVNPRPLSACHSSMVSISPDQRHFLVVKRFPIVASASPTCLCAKFEKIQELPIDGSHPLRQ